MHNILVDKDSGLIKDYDRDYLILNNNIIAIKNGTLENIFSDLNSSNCNVYQIENDLVDFIGNKYIYSDGVITENPNFDFTITY